jgi:aspartate aminotransferase
MLKLSQKALAIKPSATLAVATKAKEMKSKGIDVISFGPGEPDFDTPEHIKEAGIKAINEGFTRYTPTPGIIELKEAICQKLARENNISYKPSQIVVSNGAKHALYNAVQAVCDPGDEVIIPVPCWVSYTSIVELVGGKPVFLYTSEDNGFQIDLDELQQKITDKTVAIMLNTPNNPTGCAYTHDVLKGIAELAEKYGFYIISDEIYEKLVYDDVKHYSVASFSDSIKDLTIVINGVSKSYAMTGWRIGYAAANPKVAKAMADIQSHETSNPNSIAQKASVVALAGDQEPVDMMIKEFGRRRNAMVEKINAIPGLSCRQPDGAFYVMMNISKILGKSFEGQVLTDSMVFADTLLEKAKVAVTAGAAFGPEGVEVLDSFVRMSYATDMESIIEGVNRIKDFVEKLS